MNSIASHLPHIEFKNTPEDLTHWGQDWTRFYTPRPLVIAFPANTNEVSELLSYCNEHSIAVVPSGGRTGLAGGAVATKGELVLSLDKLRAMGPIDMSASTIRVEAGVVTKRIQEAAQEAGLYWPIDLASSGSCHIGGNIATNAGGLHVIRYGHTRRWIQSLEVVLMDGRILELNGDLDKNNTGYDFRNLFIGSEGTLGVITAATLKLCEAPQSLQTFLLGLSKLNQAIEILAKLRAQGFVLHTFEVFSKNCKEIVQKLTHKNFPFQDPQWSFYLLFEVDTLHSPQTLNKLNLFIEKILSDALITEAFHSQSPKDSRDYWFWRENITESLNTQGMVYKNDVAVPIRSIAPFMDELQDMSKDWFGPSQVFLFGHLGDGNIHINLLKPKSLDAESFLKQCETHNEALFKLLQKYKGSIAAEHGIGLLKKRYLHYSRNTHEIQLMKQVKELFDPKGLLNPGKIFSENLAPRFSSPFRIVWKDYDLGLAESAHLQPYSPNWAKAFKKFESLFHECLPQVKIKFHHIGSTAIGDETVEGIKSKPIIDILGVVKDFKDFDPYQKDLEALGLIGMGENGIPGRRFYKLKSWRGPETFFHIHIFEETSKQVSSYLLFRDYLRAHPHVAKAYEEQKMRLQSLFHESRDRYNETKSAMIRDILGKAQFWKEKMES
jgi:FAD/FMN-containing dehydrogenase/GrpB-like predicted nucleotidyltransferase (UPF0157 family)